MQKVCGIECEIGSEMVTVSLRVYHFLSTGTTKEDISPCCLIENFTEVAVYAIPSSGRNVVLKYQGQGAMELRRLTTTKVEWVDVCMCVSLLVCV